MKTHENSHISWISFVEPTLKNLLFEHISLSNSIIQYKHEYVQIIQMNH